MWWTSSLPATNRLETMDSFWVTCGLTRFRGGRRQHEPSSDHQHRRAEHQSVPGQSHVREI